jgi:hypothetical protein
MFLIKKELFEVIVENKYLLKEEEIGKITDVEKEIIFRSAKEFGFELKEEAPFFQSVVKQASHPENPQAVIFIRGNYGLKKSFFLETDQGRRAVNVLVYQFSQIERRLDKISSFLMENKLAVLFKGLDKDYLATVLKETNEVYIYEEIKDKAKNKQIFNVVFKEDGSFEIEEQGRV